MSQIDEITRNGFLTRALDVKVRRPTESRNDNVTGRSVPEWQQVAEICMLALTPLGVLSGRLRLYSFSG